MTKGQRIAMLAAAVVVLAGAFVLAQGSNDDGGQNPGATQAAGQTTTEPTGGAQAPADGDQAPATTAEAPAPAPRVESIRIEGGKPASAARTLRFGSGDTVRLKFTSDTAQEIHIHGYDRYVDVPAGGSKVERFKATAEGIFEVELHSTGALLAKLEVQP